MGNKLIMGISAAALAAGVGLGATQLATAETTTPTPTPSTSTAPEDDSTTGHEGRGGRGGHGGMGIDVCELATKLGVDEATLKEAVSAVREATASESKPTAAPTEAERTAKRAAFAKTLAEKLGLDEAKVADAIAEVREAKEAEKTASEKERLDQAVTDGDLTRAEADAVQKALDAGIVSMGRGKR